MSRIGSDRREADGIRVDFFTRFTTLQILAEIQNMLTQIQCKPEQAIPRTDYLHVNVRRHCLVRQRSEQLCIANSKLVADYAKRFAYGHWSFLGPEFVLRTIISVNQLNIYGAVADRCDELACRISDCSGRTGKPVAQNNPET